MSDKQLLGQYFTTKNVLQSNTVYDTFIKKYNLLNQPMLEPFAGAGHLVLYSKAKSFQAYDLEPQADFVQQNNSLTNWNYKNYTWILTNPPYLSLSSAKRKGLAINWDTKYDDLYKYCLDICLKHCQFVIAIIPASFIVSKCKTDQWLLKHLSTWQYLSKSNFDDTKCPVGIAYFDNSEHDSFDIYENNDFIAKNIDLISKENAILIPKNKLVVKMNDPHGTLWVHVIDNNTDTSAIKFFENSNRDTKTTDRNYSKIRVVPNAKLNIDVLNTKIKLLRDNKCDYLWVTFKNLNKHGKYRRRMPFSIVKKIINSIDLKE